MSNQKTRLAALMRGMVDRNFKGNHALAAAEIQGFITGKEVDLDKADPGAFSRKFHGSRDWSFLDVIAMQRLAGSTRITDAFLADAPADPAKALSNLQHAAALIKEGGEAASALMSLESGEGCIAKTRAELLEAQEAIANALAAIEASERSVLPMPGRAAS